MDWKKKKKNDPIERINFFAYYICSEKKLAVDLPLKKPKQDGRLAPAYFLPNYNYFDKLLQTVKDRTTVLLVFKEFLQTSVPTVFSVISAKVYHDFPLEKFCLIVPKNFEQEPFCVSESFGYRKILSLRGENHDFL